MMTPSAPSPAVPAATGAAATSAAPDRIGRCFAGCRSEARPALITYVMAGDPDPATSLEVLHALVEGGADMIELGMPFTDPMADGPVIQAAALRALAAGQTVERTLGLVRRFREGDAGTPLVLMGYFNPIYVYGVDAFVADAKEAGVDGLIVVDLPPEADGELCLPALRAGLSFVHLATPTTDAGRLPRILENTVGFLYYVSVTGVTGAASADTGALEAAVTAIRESTELPVVVGFGVRSGDQVAAIAGFADGVVVGSALVDAMAACLDEDGRPLRDLPAAVRARVSALSDGARGGGWRTA